MDLFDLLATISLNTSGYDSGIDEVEEGANDAENALNGIGDSADDASDGLNAAGDAGEDAAGGLDAAGDAGDSAAGGMDAAADAAEGAADSFDSASNAAGSTESSVGLLDVAFGNLAANGVATAVSAIGDFIGNAVSTGDNIDKMSQKLGISTDAYQEWGYICDICGASVDGLKTGIKTMSGVITDAANGSETAAEKLDAVGLSVDDLNGKSQEEQLSIVVAALQDMEEGAERTSAATDLLGRSGTDMAAVFNLSAEETENLRQEAHDLGIVLDEETVQASADLNDQFTRVGSAFSSVGAQVASAFMPVISDLCDFILNNILPAVQNFIEWLGQFSPIFDVIGSAVSGVVGVLGALFSAVGEVVGVIMSAVSSIYDTASPIITAIGELIQMVWEAIQTATETVFGGIADFISEIWQGIWDFIGPIVTGIADTIGAAWEAISGFTDTVFGGIGDFIGGIWDGITGKTDESTAAVEQDVEESFSAAESAADSSMSSLSADVSSNMNSAESAVASDSKSIAADAKSNFSAAEKEANSDFSSIESTISKDMSAAQKDVSSNTTSMNTAVASDLTAAANSADTALQSIGTSATKNMNDASTAVANSVKAIKTSISELNNLATSVGTAFNNIASTIKTAMNTAVSNVQSGVSSIKSSLNTTITGPNVKLPHITVTGSWNFETGSVPSYSVSWYRQAMDQAMLLNGATIFGMNGNTLLGGGEAGSEMIIGTETMMNMIAAATNTGDLGDKLDEVIKLLQKIDLQQPITQNIYSQKQTAADLMKEARYEQQRAVIMGV